MDQKYVLRTPYAEPDEHIELDEKGRTTNNTLRGRRPSEAAAGLPGEAHAVADPAEVEPHKTINELRDALIKWRKDNHEGATSKTRKLLDFWRDLESASETHPFWCQMEAVETMIWLLEAGQTHDLTTHERVWRRIRAVNNMHNEDAPRLAFKMATGSGKTHVMAMAMLWMLVNGTARDDSGTTHFLVITPNLTVKKRLEVLKPDYKKEPWASITPRRFRGALSGANVTVVNFQAFQNRSYTLDGKTPGAKEKRLLGDNIRNWKESDTGMISRILRGHGTDSQIIVINDEAHHCYKPAAPASTRDEYVQAAALWFNAIRLLKEQGRLARVYDFSATPRWISGQDRSASDVFPWTVSDFPLLDAIESGLVKIPRIPVSDDADSGEPKYRNVYEYNGGKPLNSNLAVRVSEPLCQIYAHYKDVVDPAYGNNGIIPVFIVVANNIRNAVAIYRWIAGSPGAGNNGGNAGGLDLFSNYTKDGEPLRRPPTLLVHSRLFDKTPTGRSAEGRMVGEMATLFGLEGSVADKQEGIRKIFTSVGQDNRRNIRCVISVGMLTEGWDAKNVTHVFGYRKFDSLLLCEQVTGRALRRTSFSGMNEVQSPEYANVFGVPYTFARGGDVDPQPAAQEYRVHTVPDMEAYRISFPNVMGYRKPRRLRRFSLDPDKVTPYVVGAEPTRTTSAGSTGEEAVTRRGRGAKFAIWKTAGSLSTILTQDTGQNDGESYVATGRRRAFLDSVRIVEEWLDHDSITYHDMPSIAADDDIPQAIAAACRHDDEDVKVAPVFADEHHAGERLGTTEGIDFRTTLRYTHKKLGNATVDGTDADRLEKSELNRAACHSGEEAAIAGILDGHPKIEAWARNFGLGFSIPWFDDAQQSWREMDPDFVARVKGKEKLRLAIEFKGLRRGEPEEEAKRRYLEEWWCPAVSGHRKHGAWKSVWIENVSDANELINEACK